MKKPKLPKLIKPPFRLGNFAYDYYVVDSNGNIIASRAQMKTRGRNSRNEMRLVCFALNLAYPVKADKK